MGLLARVKRSPDEGHRDLGGAFLDLLAGLDKQPPPAFARHGNSREHAALVDPDVYRVPRGLPIELHVRHKVGDRVSLAREREFRPLADHAVRSVAAHEVPRLDVLLDAVRPPDLRDDPLAVLRKPEKGRATLHLYPALAEGFDQERLGHALRDHDAPRLERPPAAQALEPVQAQMKDPLSARIEVDARPRYAPG